MKYDRNYFLGRDLEDKHFKLSLQFIDFFEPKKVLDVGCGVGHFVKAFREYKIEAYGTDLSPYAIEESHSDIKKYLKIENCTMLGHHRNYYKDFDLVMCIDLMEHLNLKEIDLTIEGLISITNKHLLLSICMFGDPNFELDETHITKKTREWWVYQFEKRGVKEIVVPKDFLFRNQMLIFKK